MACKFGVPKSRRDLGPIANQSTEVNIRNDSADASRSDLDHQVPGLQNCILVARQCIIGKTNSGGDLSIAKNEWQCAWPKRLCNMFVPI